MALLSFPSEPSEHCLHFKQALDPPASARVVIPALFGAWKCSGDLGVQLCVCHPEAGTLGAGFIFLPFGGKKC